jgi:hypothetical protein
MLILILAMSSILAPGARGASDDAPQHAASSSLGLFPFWNRAPRSLEGLTALAVETWVERSATQDLPGLKDRLTEITLERLRSAGIPASIVDVGYPELTATGGLLQVYVYYSCARVSCAYSVRAVLVRPVRVGPTSVPIAGVTWFDSYTRPARRTKPELEATRQTILVDVRTLLLGFTQDYQKANPRLGGSL